MNENITISLTKAVPESFNIEKPDGSKALNIGMLFFVKSGMITGAFHSYTLKANVDRKRLMQLIEAGRVFVVKMEADHNISFREHRKNNPVAREKVMKRSFSVNKENIPDWELVDVCQSCCGSGINQNGIFIYPCPFCASTGIDRTKNN